MKLEGGLTLKVELGHFTVKIIEKIKDLFFKAAGTDMKYFSKSKFLKSLVYKKKFTLMWMAVSKLEYLSCPGSSYEIFRKEWIFREFCLQEKIYLDMNGSFQVRILIVSREFGCFFCV